MSTFTLATGSSPSPDLVNRTSRLASDFVGQQLNQASFSVRRKVWSFREGESMSRMMLCRLSPDSAGQGALGPEQAFEAYFRSLE
mmetsp:Transcript_39804/g.158290  ORF Transcript_39804/g.158290 Transcript_39804/m.158290 type:complete len:85 (-) Transcript_39804:1648-1902(-)